MKWCHFERIQRLSEKRIEKKISSLHSVTFAVVVHFQKLFSQFNLCLVLDFGSVAKVKIGNFLIGTSQNKHKTT